MSEQRDYRVAFDPSNIVLTAGATSANEALMFCLADQGDAFLIPTPYYPGYVPCRLSTYLSTLRARQHLPMCDVHVPSPCC